MYNGKHKMHMWLDDVIRRLDEAFSLVSEITLNLRYLLNETFHDIYLSRLTDNHVWVCVS